jgi:hypothetical protein
MTEEAWHQHTRSRSHRRGMKKRKKEEAQRSATESSNAENRQPNEEI